MGRIDTIAIEITTICAANCVICVREKYRGKITTMTQELFEKCVEEAVQGGVTVINLCGFGETLMDRELETKLKYVKHRYPNVKIVLTTTGYNLKDHVLDTVCEYVDEINFSMYGMKKSTYENVHRGKMNYEENKKNIDELLGRKKRPYTIVSFVDLPINHEEIDEWKQYYENKADQINIWKTHRWPHSNDADISFRNKKPCRCSRIDTLNGLYIKVDGEVSPCCFDFNTELSIGNINESSLQEIMNGAVVKGLRTMQESDSLRCSDMICGDCDQLYSREDALIYSSDRSMTSGKKTFFRVMSEDDENI